MAKKEKTTELVKKEDARPVSFFEEMEKDFHELFQHPFSMMMHPMWPNIKFPKFDVVSPSVDIFEAEGEVVIKAEAPGMTKKDIEVTITENTVTISGEKKQEEKIEKKNYYREERSYGSFRRSFRLPENVKGDNASASFKDGVLEIHLPKVKASKQKKITIE